MHGPINIRSPVSFCYKHFQRGFYGLHPSFKCYAVSQRFSMVKTVSRFRWIAAGWPLIPRRSWFNTCPVNVELLVGKVALGLVFLQVLWFSFVSIIPPMLHVLPSFIPFFHPSFLPSFITDPIYFRLQRDVTLNKISTDGSDWAVG